MSLVEIALIADHQDHPSILACLQPYNYTISAAVGSEGEFLQQLNQTSPPSMNLCLVKLSGTSRIRRLYEKLKLTISTARIIVLTQPPNMPLPPPPRPPATAQNAPRIYADVIARALKDGAFGYIETAAAPSDYQAIIDKVLKDQATIEPIVAQALRPLLALLGGIYIPTQERAVFQRLLATPANQRAAALSGEEEKRLYNFLGRLHRK